MNKKLNDEQIDRLLRTLANDAAANDTAVDEIADSPQLWWGVQRKIATEREQDSLWNSASRRRWLMFAAPLAAAVLIAGFFILQPAGDVSEKAVVIPAPAPSSSDEIASKAFNNAEPAGTDDGNVNVPLGKSRPISIKRPLTVKKRTGSNVLATSARDTAPEIKSEFIALSYAGNPESGQIVRVKVPSSMMVSLGLVTSVEKPTSLVNAEIVVGDDGITHAIRFIR